MIRIISDIVEIKDARSRSSRISAADEELKTIVSEFEAVSPDDLAEMHEAEEHGQIQGLAPAERERILRVLMGESERKNAQAREYMDLSQSNTGATKRRAGFNIAVNSLAGIDDVFALTKMHQVRLVTVVLPRLTEFIGWIVNTGYDRKALSDSIEKMLGDRSFAAFRYPHFNDVLKRETGITNKHYLVDLARIFSAIDVHAMIRNPDAPKGDIELGKKVVGTLYGNVNDESVKTVKLKDLLRYAGLGEGTDWRTLLKNSLMA